MLKNVSDEKNKARRSIQTAVKMGWYQIPPCEGCGSTNHIDALHEDYSEPYNVLWLCRSCRAGYGKNELVLKGPKAPPIDTTKPCHECGSPIPRKKMTGLQPNTPALCEKCKEMVRFCVICKEVKSIYDFSPTERRCKPCNTKRVNSENANKVSKKGNKKRQAPLLVNKEKELLTEKTGLRILAALENMTEHLSKEEV